MRIPDSLSNDLKVAIEAAQNAGNVVINAYQTNIFAESKGDKGLVTEFDKKAEQAIINTLRSKSPYSILGEESGLSSQNTEQLWAVDPIDGTTNFSRKLSLFAISIALVDGEDIILGVIFNPSTNECFYAEKGQGAYLNGKRIQVSSNHDPAQAIVFLEYGYAEDDLKRMTELTKRLGSKYGLRLLGTTAVALCNVAIGVADLFISSGDELWDYAAGVLLVQEAGGKFTDWHGHRWDGKNSFIFASNGRLHGKVLKEISGLQP